MGAIPTLVSPTEYLETAFPDGDHEYVDGQVVERTMAEKDNSTAHRRIILLLLDLRTATSSRRFLSFG
ncbi:MAG: hypothetical protein MUF01_00470 [Bryobacterales bacterium]|jgi:hypothetical protein|nr:hypothetical protein [Bryobacterales bacterium]